MKQSIELSFQLTNTNLKSLNKFQILDLLVLFFYFIRVSVYSNPLKSTINSRRQSDDRSQLKHRQKVKTHLIHS